MTFYQIVPNVIYCKKKKSIEKAFTLIILAEMLFDAKELYTLIFNVPVSCLILGHPYSDEWTKIIKYDLCFVINIMITDKIIITYG